MQNDVEHCVRTCVHVCVFLSECVTFSHSQCSVARSRHRRSFSACFPCGGTKKMRTNRHTHVRSVAAEGNVQREPAITWEAPLPAQLQPGRCTTTLVSESGVDTKRLDALRLVVARRRQCFGGRKEQAALSCQGEKNILMVDTFSSNNPPPSPHLSPPRSFPDPPLAFNIQQLSDLMRSFVNGQFN